MFVLMISWEMSGMKLKEVYFSFHQNILFIIIESFKYICSHENLLFLGRGQGSENLASLVLVPVGMFVSEEVLISVVDFCQDLGVDFGTHL